MNTFKRNDKIKWHGYEKTVSYTSGPYVFFVGGGNASYQECRLVQPKPKFGPGDIVHNRASDQPWTIKCVKTKNYDGTPYTGPMAYDYVGNDGDFDYEESLTLIRRADEGHTLGDILNTALRKRGKFKAGDVVRHITNGPKTYTVAHVRYDGQISLLGWESTGHFDPSYYELAPKSHHIVARKVGNGYQPSANPRLHDTERDANAEAQRLAVKHPGVEFGTFSLIATTKAPTPVAVTVKA